MVVIHGNESHGFRIRKRSPYINTSKIPKKSSINRYWPQIVELYVKKQRNMWKTGISWPFCNFPSVHINVVSCLRPPTLEASAASQCGWMPFVGDEGCAQNEKCFNPYWTLISGGGTLRGRWLIRYSNWKVNGTVPTYLVYNRTLYQSTFWYLCHLVWP